VAVNPGFTALTLMPVSRSSYASCTVIMFRAALEPQQPSILYEANAQVGSLFSVSDPKPLDKLTILPAFAFRINGNMALVTARVPKKVDIEDSTHRVKVCTAWRTIISVHDACVIHQNIEPSVLRSYPLRCCRNCFFFQEVEWNRIDLDSLASEHCSRCIPLLRITRTQQDSHTGAAQLARDLKPNALVCASN
jgi:hypothetical protein